MRAKFFRKFSALCLAALSAATYTHAQDASRIYVEQTGFSIGTNFGLTDMWGDVGTKTVTDHYTNSKYFDKVAFMGGMFGRYTMHPALSFRLSANYGTLFATDEWNYDKAKKANTQGDDAYQRYARNQKAKADVLESTFMVEFTPRRRKPESKKAHKRGQYYIAAGIGGFHFTPYSTIALGTKYVKTYDLHLEGDGFGAGYPKTYSLYQFCIPMAVGYRWDLGKHLNLGIEYQYRKTFTDYLDGVSGKYVDPAVYLKHLSAPDALLAWQIADKSWYKGLEAPNAGGNMRGNPGNKDAYSTISVTFYYKIFTATKEWWHEYQ